MNRLLTIPFVAICAGFVALVFVNANLMPTSSGSTDSSIAGRLLDASTIEEMLLAKWDETTPLQYSFSRVQRPTHRYDRPEILVDLECPTPDEAFVGTVRLKHSVDALVETTGQIDFPLVVDRKTGQTVVYSDNQWVLFEPWVLSLSL